MGRDAKVVIDKSLKDIEKVIEEVQKHFFPENSKIPSAKSMHTLQFLLETISHKTYDRDIYIFIIEGAKELQSREKGKFIYYSNQEKEIALREYEKTLYGSRWLSRIMLLTIEAIFSDPIYGSNINENGWKVLKVYGGRPRPVTRYIKQ
jgi:hypothetical protein